MKIGSRERTQLVAETALRWTLTTEAEPPDQSTTGHLRYRMNKLINADLRFSYGQ